MKSKNFELSPLFDQIEWQPQVKFNFKYTDKHFPYSIMLYISQQQVLGIKIFLKSTTHKTDINLQSLVSIF